MEHWYQRNSFEILDIQSLTHKVDIFNNQMNIIKWLPEDPHSTLLFPLLHIGGNAYRRFPFKTHFKKSDTTLPPILQYFFSTILRYLTSLILQYTHIVDLWYSQPFVSLINPSYPYRNFLWAITLFNLQYQIYDTTLPPISDSDITSHSDLC